MPKVFTGKVVIPGEKIDEYFQLVEESRKQRAPFREKLCQLNNDFYDFLLTKFTKKTARKHSSIIEMFIEFLVEYTDVDSIETVAKGMTNSYFRRWYKKKVWDSTTETEIKTAIKKFFLYLKTHKNIINEAVLKSF